MRIIPKSGNRFSEKMMRHSKSHNGRTVVHPLQALGSISGAAAVAAAPYPVTESQDRQVMSHKCCKQHPRLELTPALAIIRVRRSRA
jgi:hypothetical protein